MRDFSLNQVRELELPQVTDWSIWEPVKEVQFEWPEQQPLPNVNMPNVNLALGSVVSPDSVPGVDITVRVEPRPNPAKRENRPSHDKKSKGQTAYIAMLAFVNRTWGKVSEVIDFYDVLMDNIKLKSDQQIGTGKYDTILVNYDTALSDLPMKYVRVILESEANGADLVYIDWQGFAFGLAAEQAVDAMIGELSRRERDWVRNSDMWRNAYGTPTT